MKYSIVLIFLVLLCLKVYGNYGELYGEYGEYGGDFGDCAYPDWIGDGECDDETNNALCNFDGGDCGELEGSVTRMLYIVEFLYNFYLRAFF